jgi:hypothetical protein
MPSADSLITRYRAGDRDAVWQELRALGAGARSPERVADAHAVCDEMAKRARQNVEVIVDRLRAQGFVFHANDAARTPVTPPRPAGKAGRRGADLARGTLRRDPHDARLVDASRRDVWLVGTHPDWPESSAADPLVIEVEGSRHDAPIEGAFAEDVEAHEERTAAGATAPFELAVSPDRLHKDDVSGGPPYGIVLPDPCADGTFVAETTMPFVSYLNWVFSRGGFPVRTGPTEDERRVRKQLARDLLPL